MGSANVVVERKAQKQKCLRWACLGNLDNSVPSPPCTRRLFAFVDKYTASNHNVFIYNEHKLILRRMGTSQSLYRNVINWPTAYQPATAAAGVERSSEALQADFEKVFWSVV